MLSHLPQSVNGWLLLSSVLGTLLLVAVWLFSRRRYQAYPAMHAYLLINVFAGAILITLAGLPRLAAVPGIRITGWSLWLAAYSLSAALIFLITQQILHEALDPLPGLRRLAHIAFRWVVVVSVSFSFLTAIVPLITHTQTLPITLLQIMRCISVVEFCLLAFVLLAVQALDTSWRSSIVGIPLGLSLLALADTVCLMVVLRTGAHLMLWLLIGQIASAVAATLWLLWLLLPEPARLTASQRTTQLQRWNEIAVALGKPVPHVALSQQETHSLFLQDVEAVVDRVLHRNDVQPR